MDRIMGPLTKTEAADACGCSENQLYTGAMGARQEKDKIRPIYDASISEVNKWIQMNTTTAPGLQDAMHAPK